MKFTESDRAYLREHHHEPDEAIRQIEAAVSKTVYSLAIKGESTKISRKKAIEILGREKWLSGMDRSAFHRSATYTTNDGKTVYFDSRRFFREN